MKKEIDKKESHYLNKLIDYLQMSTNEFSNSIGLERPDRLYNILNGRNGVSSDLANIIISRYNNVEYLWLITGKGLMLKGECDLPEYSISENGDGVPYYNVDFTLGFDLVENDQTLIPAYHIKFPKYRDALCWVNATGDSMTPLINHGDMVALKRLDNWRDGVLFGEVYAIVTNDFRTIKKIRKSARGEEYFLFVPENTDGFDDQEVLKDSILTVYKVLGCSKIL